MKIAILSRYQGKVNRGAESVVEELSKRLRKNHQVDILAGASSDDLWKVIRGRYDVVMPMNGRWQSLKVSLGRIVGGYKLIISGQSGIGKDDIFNILICRPNVFLALTNYMADWAKSWAFGVRIVKISNGVDLEKFKHIGDNYINDLPKPIILSVGALNWYKHHERTIEAVSLLKEGALLIVGDGPDKNKLKKLGEEKLKDRFKIIKLPYIEVPTVYRSADVFTLPSWDREAFGVVYLEAMASGLGVVAPNDTSRREIVGEGGILTDVTNANRFAEALQKALSRKWGIVPRKQAEKFSWEKVTWEYEECLKSI